MYRNAFVLVLICHSCLSYVHYPNSMTFRAWNDKNLQQLPPITKKVDSDWVKIKTILDKMAPHLETAAIEIPTLYDLPIAEKVEFQNVVIVNWLVDVKLHPVTVFDTLGEDDGDKDENDGYDKDYVFKLDERVAIVNFTIPQILFTGRFLFHADDKQGTVHCAMDNMSVGMFVHFSRTNNIIYVDNFQMIPPEKSFVLIANEVASNLGYVNDSLESEWKLAVWLTTYKLMEDYLTNFMLTDVELLQ